MCCLLEKSIRGHELERLEAERENVERSGAHDVERSTK